MKLSKLRVLTVHSIDILKKCIAVSLNAIFISWHVLRLSSRFCVRKTFYQKNSTLFDKVPTAVLYVCVCIAVTVIVLMCFISIVYLAKPSEEDLHILRIFLLR